MKVPSYVMNKYMGESFTCDNGERILTSADINDEYCDCLDGSDEPGTNACSSVPVSFACENKGYKILKLPTSRVNDGVCDCCDGSDEYLRVTCPDTCAAVALSEKTILDHLASSFKTGSALRRENIQRVQQQKQELVQKLPGLRVGVDNHKLVVQVRRIHADSTLRHYEEQQRSRRQQLEQETLTQSGISSVPDDQVPRLLAELLDALELGANDVRVLLQQFSAQASVKEVIGEHSSSSALPIDATDAASSLDNTDDEHRHQRHPHHDHHHDSYDDERDGEGEDELDLSHSGDVEVEVQAQASSELSAACSLDLVNTHSNGSGGEEGQRDQRLAQLCQTFSGLDSTLLATLARRVVLWVVEKRDGFQVLQLVMGYRRLQHSFEGAAAFVAARRVLEVEVEVQHEGGQAAVEDKACLAEFLAVDPALCEVSSARVAFEELSAQESSGSGKPQGEEEAYLEARAALQAAESEVTAAEAAQTDLDNFADFLAFLAIRDDCFEVVDAKFTYRVCVLSSVMQTEEGSSNGVLLGNFDVLEEVDEEEHGVLMRFTNGQHCHAFGPRTADVKVVCGADNKLVSASEPSTCFYSLLMESPAACSDSFAQFNGIAY